MEVVGFNDIQKLVKEEKSLFAVIDFHFNVKISKKCEEDFIHSIATIQELLDFARIKPSKIKFTIHTEKAKTKEYNRYYGEPMRIIINAVCSNPDIEKLRLSPEGDEYIAPEWLYQDDFDSEICILVLALIISSGAAVDIIKTELFCNRLKYEGTNCTNISLGGAEILEITREYGWPRITVGNFYKIFKWLTSFRFDILSSGHSRVGIALNAFTEQLLAKNSSFIYSLIFSMISLEALFCDERNGKKQQIDANSQLLLGKRKSFIKLIQRMYQLRSEILHGTLGLSGAFLKYDAEKQFDENVSDLVTFGFLSQAVVLASFQKLCQKDIRDYIWETKTKLSTRILSIEEI